MLKKILIVIMVLAILAGIGYLGYVVFMAKNIEKVEMSGNMQTIYFVDDDINFENAQIKVTYKNGDMKLLNLKDADVSVSLFSTSLAAHGKMKITYKNFTIEQEYDVVSRGCHYIESIETTNANGDTEPIKTYASAKDSTTLYYFYKNGELRYYTQKDGKWFMNDGKYDKTYNYTISGDTIIVSLGKNKKVELKANYDDNGFVNLVSTEKEMSSTNPEMATKIVKSSLKTASMKTNSKIVTDQNKSGIDYVVSGVTDTEHPYITFKVGEKINTHDAKIYLKIVYSNDTIFPDHTVYVEVCDEMNTGIKKIDTSRSMSANAYDWADLCYGDETEGNHTFIIWYKVV